MKKAFVRLCVLLVVLSFFHGEGGAASDDRRAGAVERKVIDLVNRVRTKGVKCGNKFHAATHPLKWSDSLAEASRRHSFDMARQKNMDHTGGDGSDAGKRIARAGYRWMTYGENVGEGFLTPEEVVSAWLRSEGHCENIMSPAFREAGAAFARSGKRVYWTLVFATPQPSSFSGSID